MLFLGQDVSWKAKTGVEDKGKDEWKDGLV